MLFSFVILFSAPPSRPMGLNMTVIKSQWALISWKPPENRGTGGPVSYRIHCKQCDISMQFTEELYLNLTNLKTYTDYNIAIYAVNNVTKAIDKENFNKLHFKTLSGCKCIFLLVIHL